MQWKWNLAKITFGVLVVKAQNSLFATVLIVAQILDP